MNKTDLDYLIELEIQRDMFLKDFWFALKNLCFGVVLHDIKAKSRLILLLFVTDVKRMNFFGEKASSHFCKAWNFNQRFVKLEIKNVVWVRNARSRITS